MYNELIISTSNKKHKVFFMNGFYETSEPASNLHKHNFSEIHLVTGGSADFLVGDKPFTLEDGGMMIIPGGVFHCCKSRQKDAHHTAFQIDYDTKSTVTHFVGSSLISDFMKEAALCRQSGDYSKVSSYIGLLCSHLCLDEKLSARSVSDYGFLINEYLSLHYNEDIHLSDLAVFLHLSQRQTERLVVQYTGKSFRNELIDIRIKIASRLVLSSDLSLREIASYVGYNSYAGFWKAAKKAGIIPPEK